MKITVQPDEGLFTEVNPYGDVEVELGPDAVMTLDPLAAGALGVRLLDTTYETGRYPTIGSDALARAATALLVMLDDAGHEALVAALHNADEIAPDGFLTRLAAAAHTVESFEVNR